MVISYNSVYNKNYNIQVDIILKEREGKFILQERLNLFPYKETEFNTEDEALTAFEVIETLLNMEKYNNEE